MKKTLIIGCGFLGNQIFTNLKKNNFEVVGTNFEKISKKYRKLDITNWDQVHECINDENPDLVINCAANTNLDILEKNQDLANSINGYGAENVADVCKSTSTRLIQISTDAVFDGSLGMYKENDNPNPINIYGKSKLLGEKLVKNKSKNFMILRTNMFGFDQNERFLFNWVLKNLKENKQITGFNDVIFNPLEISILSEYIIKLGSMNNTGILHLGSDEIFSKFDFCLKIADIFNLDRNLIKKGSIEDMKFVAKRPKNTSLSNAEAKKILKIQFPTLNEEIMKIKQVYEGERN